MKRIFGTRNANWVIELPSVGKNNKHDSEINTPLEASIKVSGKQTILISRIKDRNVNQIQIRLFCRKRSY